MSSISHAQKRLPARATIFWRAAHHGSVVIGGSVLAVIVIAALLAPWLSPHDPYAQNLSSRLVDPIWNDGGSWAHPLGTDALGRDYLARLLHGARISLLIGGATTILSGIIGSTMGLMAGYFGGRVDLVVNFLITTRLTLPVVLVALAVVAGIGNSLPILIAVIGLLLWDRFAVVVRSSTQQLANLDFIAAAKIIGCSRPRIIFREILPNVINPIVVVATIEMTHAILLEASLSFLGLGVQPPLPSWGLMIAEARGHFFFSPWLIGIPGLALSILIMAINLIGDGIRDITSPQGRA